VIRSRRGLRPLLAAELISTTGSAMTALALPWLVLSTTGSPSRAGLVAAIEWLPTALLGIPSGTLATRLGPRRTMLACDIGRAPAVAALPLLYWAGALPFGLLLALAFLIGSFFPAHFSSQRTLLPELLGEGFGDLTRANVLLQAANRLPLVLGPALGGLLIASFGAAEVLLVDAGTYATSAALIAVRVPRVEPPQTAAGSAGVWAGVRALARARPLGALTIAFAIQELGAQAAFLALPILAYTAYDGRPGVAGALLAAWATGAFAGTPLAMRLAGRDPLRLVRAGLACQALPLWLVGLPLPLGVTAASLALSGLANPVANAPALTLVTTGVPEALRAKAMLAFTTAATATGGVGLFLAGPLAEAVGARHVILGTAALATACAAGLALATRARPGDIVVCATIRASEAKTR
jgi:MFS family permease